MTDQAFFADGSAGEADKQAFGDSPDDEVVQSPTAGSGADNSLTPEARSRLIGQFERWLDQMTADEPAPQGLTDEFLAELRQEAPTSTEADIYRLSAALTALSGEVRLQGRAFKSLGDAIAPVADMPDRLASLESAMKATVLEVVKAVDRVARPTADVEQGSSPLPPAKEILEVLFDLQPRLERGLAAFDETDRRAAEVAASRQGGLLGRLFKGKHEPDDDRAQTLKEGYSLTLSRLEGALRQWGIRRIGRPGEMFDSTTMAVTDVESTDGVADGTVLEVYRSGYALNDRVLATARVKVSRNSKV